jgi:hypothetical protein
MDLAWPLSGDDAQLLGELALLIERGGAGHFLDAPVIGADTRDFPEVWKPTAAAVERLLARLFWLAYVDLDVAIEDVRRAGVDTKLLQRSAIEWIETSDGVGQFRIEKIGNDNVAGLLVHEVGRAVAAWLVSASPYREGPLEAPTALQGSIAAVYLGLGVMATNAALYNRTAGALTGQVALSEWEVVSTGGLSPRSLLLLLAVQAVLREGPIEAHATLRTDLRELLEPMIARLRPHRAELATLLGIDLQAARPALERDPAPVTIADADRPEPSLYRRSEGARTFAVPGTQLRAGLGKGLLIGIGALMVVTIVLGWLRERGGTHGAAALVLLVLVTLVPIVVGAISGWQRPVSRCSDPGCEAELRLSAATCPGCGASIAGQIRSANLRLDAEEWLDEHQQASLPDGWTPGATPPARARAAGAP